MKINFTKMHGIGNDYVYADTDSVKFFNYEKHAKYFEQALNGKYIRMALILKLLEVNV